MAKLATYKIIDTYDDFLACWEIAHSKPLQQKIRLWQTAYMSKYPELLRMQIESYESDGYGWREIARHRIFPKLNRFLPLMAKARKNLLGICGPVYERLAQMVGLDFDINFVVYVGLGCGAGWAAKYENTPACLYGLEQIAELKWHTAKTLRHLTAHELGHLIHATWRKKKKYFTKKEKGPIFDIYSEGFAVRMEDLVQKTPVGTKEDEELLQWCRHNRKFLAGEYLKRIRTAKPVNDFFGDWLNVRGKSRTGYFMGYDLIRWLEKKYSLKQVATLPSDEIKAQVITYLRLAEQG